MKRKSFSRPLLETLESRNLPGSILRPGLGLLDQGLLDALGATASVPWQLTQSEPAGPSADTTSTSRPAAPTETATSVPDAVPSAVSVPSVGTGLGQLQPDRFVTAQPGTDDPWLDELLHASLGSRAQAASRPPEGLLSSSHAAVAGGVAANSSPGTAGNTGVSLGAPPVAALAAARIAADAYTVASRLGAGTTSTVVSPAPVTVSPAPVTVQPAPTPTDSTAGAATTKPAAPVNTPTTYSPYDFAPASARFDPVGVDPNPTQGPPGGGGTNADDPGAVGSLAVTTQEFDFGNAAYIPPDFSTLSNNQVELTASITAPTDLSGAPYPVVVLLHGNHFSTYAGSSAFYEWPPAAGHTSLPNYRGYDYFSQVLASHGYVVVSISGNGVNVIGNQRPGTGMLARGQLIERHLDILNDLNRDGIVHNVLGRPDGMIPGIDTRYVGRLDLQDVGLMGHSRGGEGAVQGYLVNQAAGSPYGIKAVFAIAPVDFQSPTINNVPFAVLLPYNDGDVSDLQGIHFFDDSRYNVAGDTGAKYSIEVMGANHNFYNTVWSPGNGYPGASDEGNPGPPSRLTQAQQRGTGLAYMSAFFRTYLHNDAQFLPILTGDAAPPPSAQVTPDRIHIGYEAADSGATRRDINRLTSNTNLTTNTLGGAVVTGGLATYTYGTGGPAGSSEPHRNLGQVTIAYTGTTSAFYENDLPVGTGDLRGYNDLQFRVGVNYGDSRNPPNMDQDFSVVLTDGSGASHSVLTSAFSNNLFYPPRSPNPHEVLNTVRVPLGSFVGTIDLSDVRSVRLNFDQHNSGAFQFTDFAFDDPSASAGPYVVASTPSGSVTGGQNHVRVVFDRPIDPTTFNLGSIDSFTATLSGAVYDLRYALTGVTPVAGSGNTQFDVGFSSFGYTGTYHLTIGPDILDLAGNPMDQNHNGIPGEVPDDEYTATFAVRGLQVTSATVNATHPGQATSLRVTFNEAIDPTTFTLDSISSFTANLSGTTYDLRYALEASPLGITPVAGSGNTQFDVNFLPMVYTGSYQMVIGPNILDTFGDAMDQDGNGIPGEPTDSYTAHFSLDGPRVTAITPTGSDLAPGSVDHVRVTFSVPMDPATFTADAASIIGPQGNFVSITGVQPVAGMGNTQFDVTFAPLTRSGAYQVVIGPYIADPYGNLMDQNGNGIPGEDPDDQFTAGFSLASPHVVNYNPSGSASQPVDHVRVTFDLPMDINTFTPAQVTLTGPGGAVTVNSVVEVAGSNHTQFDITFDPLPTGTYRLTLDNSIADLYGNLVLDTGVPRELVANGGFETGTFSSWTQSGDTGATFVTTSPVHSGRDAAAFGPVGGLGYITQTLATTPGFGYTLSFWLSHPYTSTGTEWLVRVGGTTLHDVHDDGNFNYTEYRYTFTATSSRTDLQFGFIEPPAYFYLDDISVRTTASGLTDGFTVT
jgi:hypothetical protein